MELLGLRETLCLTLRGTAKLFHGGCTILQPQQQGMRVSLHLQYPCYYLYFDYSNYSEGDMVSYCGFDLHFPDG